MRWSATCSASATVATSRPGRTVPWEAAIEKPSPLSRSAGGRLDERLRRRAGEQHAELVAAHPVGRAGVADGVAQPRAEAAEQRVARRVAEGVVVALEAVQVEEAEQHGLAAVERAVEVLHQPPAVAEPGERVGDRVVAAGLQHPRVGPEGHAHPHHREEQRRGGQPDREVAEPVDVVEGEQAERQHGAAGGQRGRRAGRRGAARRAGAAARPPTPSAARPPATACRCGAALDVGAVGERGEVEGVAGARREHARAQQQPLAVGAPRGGGRRPRVTSTRKQRGRRRDRPGSWRRRGRCPRRRPRAPARAPGATTTALAPRAAIAPSSHRPGGQRAAAGAQQEHQAGVAATGTTASHPASHSDGYGGAASSARNSIQRDVGGGPAGEPDADQRPREPVLGERPHPREADQRSAYEQGVVEDVGQARSAVAGGDTGRVRGEGGDEQDEGRTACRSSRERMRARGHALDDRLPRALA